MFDNRKPEEEPEGIHEVTKCGTKVSFEGRPLAGTWWRVWPGSCREVSAIRMMDHRVDKFAPATGGGVLISNNALMRFVAIR
jgi:hypothetical protein